MTLVRVYALGRLLVSWGSEGSLEERERLTQIRS